MLFSEKFKINFIYLTLLKSLLFALMIFGPCVMMVSPKSLYIAKPAMRLVVPAAVKPTAGIAMVPNAGAAKVAMSINNFKFIL